MADQKNQFWQYRDLRFDIPRSQMDMTKGEKIYWSQQHIEDFKGNEGETGTLVLTNMRFIWYQTSDYRINLSLLGDAPKIFKVFSQLYQSFNQCLFYRDIQKGSADLIKNNDIVILEKENIISQYENIQAIGSQGRNPVGTLYLTNIRFVWFSVENVSLNISIPWIQIKNVQKKSLKGKPSMIVNSYTGPLGYQTEVLNIEVLDMPQSKHNTQNTQIIEDITFVDTGLNDVPTQNTRAYITDLGSDQNQEDNEIVYAPELGLSIERPNNGASIEDLWKIIKIQK
ncbi:hypothetical protein PPERSA_02998 [Pseudocohnilembus persalinus]|uniref:BBSome complex member BBS5 PH domain-containing protein n=1 Tax=Pseudocohnilembus persalinus TaxID=266149 RepID=A0A0V0QEV5_PSEPJ|nr:hypothetical protein PPERSA_02998 [Pseudocohnilembus persalinus]|eukprot:KRX00738.1 hypothetical protein PPERSA_02998 [Pseudocohnilembus persalinus]